MERSKTVKFFSNPTFLQYDELQKDNLCVMEALNNYLQCELFRDKESFLRVYAMRKKKSIEVLRHEIESAGIRLFYLQKIAYNNETDHFLSARLIKTISTEELTTIVKLRS